MPLPAFLTENLRLPVIGSPMFLVSFPELVIAQCCSGIIGSFPAANARPAEELDRWIERIREALARHDEAHPDKKAAPFAINLIVNKKNDRLQQDLATCVRHRVPIVITSLGAQPEVNAAIHSYGGIVLHDATTVEFARKAVERGADGIIAVCAGAGGHAGHLSPFALVQEIRAWWQGPLVLGGAIANGRAIRAAQVLGCDLAYIGTPFILTRESAASSGYKQAIAEAHAADIVNSAVFTGVPANYLRQSILAAGLDPVALKAEGAVDINSLRGEGAPKAWRDIWGAGQGVGALREMTDVAGLVDRFRKEYDLARAAA